MNPTHPILTAKSAVKNGATTEEYLGKSRFLAATVLRSKDDNFRSKWMAKVRIAGRDPSTALIFRERKISFAQDDRALGDDGRDDRVVVGMDPTPPILTAKGAVKDGATRKQIPRTVKLCSE